MITRVKADIDLMNKIGAIVPQIDGGWSTRYPIYNGLYLVGSYIVPENKKFLLKNISAHADYKNINRSNAMGGFALGTVRVKLNGTVKMEYRLQWAGGTFNAITSDTSFGYNWRALSNLINLSFSVDDVLSIEFSPEVTSGLVPQVRITGQMIWRKSDLSKDVYKFDVITTLGTANQVIASYTIPAGGANLQHLGLEGISADFMLGIIQINLDGGSILTMPCFSSSMMTRPIPVNLPFLGGLKLGEGQEISVYGDFTHALNQLVQVEIMGDEIAYGDGGEVVENKIFVISD